MTDFIDTLAELQERIRHHGDSIGRLEARTRVALIDPVLCALGWNVADPTQVRIESEVGDTRRRVDYALLGERDQPLVFIEAKKLSIKEPALEQTAAYVFAENDRRNTNVRYCIWTNGDSWLAWDISNQNQGRLIDTRVTDRSPAKTALRLLGLWRESLADGAFEPPKPLHRDVVKEADQEQRNATDHRSPDRTGQLTAQNREALLAAIKGGQLTQVQMAARFGISRSAVAYHVKRYKEGA